MRDGEREKYRQAEDDLRKALMLLEGHWIKGDYHRDGNYCAAGAIAKVTSGASFRVPGSLLQEVIGETPIDVWNDRWYRMEWQVRRAFRKAIKLARKRVQELDENGVYG